MADVIAISAENLVNSITCLGQEVDTESPKPEPELVSLRWLSCHVTQMLPKVCQVPGYLDVVMISVENFVNGATCSSQ